MAARKKTKTTELAAQTDRTAPLDTGAFLKEAAKVLKLLKQDLQARSEASPAVRAALMARHEREREQERTGDSFVEWRAHFIDQVAAAWLLSCVFVRTLEDRDLLGHARIAGPGALDSQRIFFELAPSLTERDYLLTVFRELSRFTATRALFDGAHNPVWLLAPSAEAAKALLQLFRTPTAEAPAFRFGQPDTRFLGDLYQDLDEGVRKRFALLQTPDFVERYILDRTLEPAIQRFGLDETTLIDPTCGSGHFLLGAFERLYEHRRRAEPDASERDAVSKALSAVAGADINPYAIAIARLRLTLAALEKAGFKKLADAPELPIKLAVADSLLYNPQLPQQELGMIEGTSAEVWLGDAYALEDPKVAREVLHRQYAAIVGNPPYIVCKDALLRDRYRKAYASAAMQFSLGAPFTERFLQLGRLGASIGMITANSFMKREFGKKLIEEILPQWNLTRVENTSGAYVPGHGTPTVILFATAEPPQTNYVHAILANRGEPSTPADPARGLVWQSLVEHGDQVGYENEYITVARLDRDTLRRHPWSLGGGGASELKDLLEARAERKLGDVVEAIGRIAHTGNDEPYVVPAYVLRARGVPDEAIVDFVEGEVLRDWGMAEPATALFPYRINSLTPIGEQNEDARIRWLWPWRAMLWQRREPNGTHREIGKTWYEYSRFHPERFRGLGIGFAFVATHNHFVLDRGGKVFKQSAPIIKLPEGATEEDHLALLAYLNSSTACFWMKQVFQAKSSEANADHPDAERNRYEFAATQLRQLPLPPGLLGNTSLATHARELTTLATEQRSLFSLENVHDLDSDDGINWARFDTLRERMIVIQEEIDWHIYRLFSLCGPETAAPELPPSASCPRGDRPCERHLPRKSFVRRGNQPVPLQEAEAPPVSRLPPALEPTWQIRTAQIRTSSELTILEHPLYKRQWRDTDDNVDEFTFRETQNRLRRANLIANLLEAESRRSVTVLPRSFLVRSTLRTARRDDVDAVAREVLDRESVPFLAAYRFTESGLEKYAEWQKTWDLQRREDAGEAVGDIPVPPKYDQKDFRDPNYWRLRGKLDVPKERFISYPGCESDEDGEPVYGWAGWNHVERAQAMAALYNDRKEREGWSTERLLPMLAGILELLPWIKQWHNEPNPDYDGLRLGDSFEGFLQGQLREHGVTIDDLANLRPAPRKKR